MTRIGIYGGTFDPLHVGHISFALAALAEANLSEVYFLPERSPRYKPDATEYSIRAKNLHEALIGYNQLKLFELPNHVLSVHETLPELVRAFPDSALVLLVGADVVTHMSTWPGIAQLVYACDIVVGMRSGYNHASTLGALYTLGIPKSRYAIVSTDQAHMSSTAIRQSKI